MTDRTIRATALALAIHLHPRTCSASVLDGAQAIADALSKRASVGTALNLVAHANLPTYQTWDELLDVAQRLAVWIDGDDFTAEDCAILRAAFPPVVAAH